MTLPSIAWLGGPTLLPVLLWSSLVASTVALLVMMRTNWGRDRPTHRYVMLSVVAHLLLICVATTIRFAALPEGDGPGPVKVRIVMRQQDPPREDARVDPEAIPAKPADDPANDPAPPLEQVTEEVTEQETAEPAEEPVEALVEPQPAAEPPEPKQPTPIEPTPVEPTPPVAPAEAAPSTEPPIAQTPAPQPTVEPPPVEPPPQVPLAAAPEPMAPLAPSVPRPAPAEPTQPVSLPPAPTAFDARDGQERLRRILEEGGDRYTEDAVAAALGWLATAQSPDGRWDADRWSAGRERGAVLGHPRQGIGARADTAMTGLSLLALMGAGHTHQQGPFATVVRDGLAYLIRTQGADGNLFGEATLYAQTYSHSMATFALAEALASTGDERLRPAVNRAVAFLIQRQDRAGGGWRYRSGAPGDMSQVGWILMALRSAELADVPIAAESWDGMQRFVRSTRCGPSLGLAGYRPNSPPSRSMTAESLYCQQILGSPVAPPASRQAAEYLTSQLPGGGRANYYAWYYTTLALHHHRRSSSAAEHAWRDWNDALKQTLVRTQVSEGVNQGSWSPHSVWGGCGGRVYSTALATMCLEVYYRYDPNQLVRDPWIAARPGPNSLR